MLPAGTAIESYNSRRVKAFGKLSSHKCLGIDPGSSAWRIAVVSDEDAPSFESVPTRRVVEDPATVLSIVEKHADGLEAIAAPSGYGLPLTTLGGLGDREFSLISLKSGGRSTLGLRSVLGLLQRFEGETGIPCFVLPSVKHLPTVPRYRKINRIDMGTPDKLCSAASALQILSEKRQVGYGEISFALCEVGWSFSALVCVRRGRIVDGVGGTETQFGTRAPGAIDAEILRAIRIEDVHRGGMVDVAGCDIDEIEEALSTGLTGRRAMAVERLVESLSSDAIALCSRNGVDEVVLSSSLGDGLNAYISTALRDLGLVVHANLGASACLGAAYVANGLVGGRYRDLSQHLMIRESTGSILDDIYIPGTRTMEV